MTLNYEVTEKHFIDFNVFHTKIHSELSKPKNFGKLGVVIRVLCLIPLIYILISSLLYINSNIYYDVSFYARMAGLAVWVVLSILIFFCAFFLIGFVIKLLGPLLDFLLDPLFAPFIGWAVKAELKSGKHNDFIGEQTLTLNDSGIEEKNPYGMNLVYYSSVEKIYYYNNCFFIYVGAIKAILVPVTAFSDDKQQENFLELLKQKTGIDVTYPKKQKKSNK